MLEYIDLRYQPSNNDLICSFYVEPDNCSLEKAARNVALESSIGTWTEIEIDKHTKKLKPNVFSINVARLISTSSNKIKNCAKRPTRRPEAISASLPPDKRSGDEPCHQSKMTVAMFAKKSACSANFRPTYLFCFAILKTGQCYNQIHRSYSENSHNGRPPYRMSMMAFRQ